jgi:hypothetical protein
VLQLKRRRGRRHKNALIDSLDGLFKAKWSVLFRTRKSKAMLNERFFTTSIASKLGM